MECDAMNFSGKFTVEHWRNGELLDTIESKNIVVNEGLTHLLSVGLKSGAQVPTWYVGIFEGNYTPVAGDTAATFPASSTESTAYDEATRQEWVEGSISGNSLNNSASKATFTINATKTIYGAFLSSLNTKGGTTGTLLCASKFASGRAVVAGDQLLVTYTLTATSA